MKLSIKEKLGYSLGDTASHFVWDMVNFWLIFYYTDVLGISPAWSTAIAILGTIMDAVMDPIVGIWADRTNTRWGKFRREAAKIRKEQNARPYRHKCAVCGRTDTDYPDLEFRYCSRCAGYHCFCEDHIANHVHFTE